MPTTIKFEGNRGYGLNEFNGSTLLNTTAETTLFSTVIPAGKLGSAKILDFKICFHISTPTLSIPTLTLKLKLGSASLTLSSTANLSANLTDKPLIVEAEISNLGVANSQFVLAKVFNNSAGLILSGLSSAFSATDGTWAVDTTVDQTLSVTGQFGALSGTTTVTPKSVRINIT